MFQLVFSESEYTVVKDIKKRLLYSKEIIDKRVRELAQGISRDYEGREVVFVCVLKGAFMFLADLSRYLTISYVVDFVRLRSYGSQSESSGTVTVTKDIEVSIEGRDVIILEDIVDTGTTLVYLRDMLEKRNPASLKICTLIDKKERRVVEIDTDYVGFDLDEGFVIGYGLDFNERFRCLPSVYVIEE